MSSNETIYVPNRPSDSPEQLFRQGTMAYYFAEANFQEGMEVWHLSGSNKPLPSPDVLSQESPTLSSWLLKSVDPASFGILGSYFAKLDLSKQAEEEGSGTDPSLHFYGFRLVSLNIVAEPEDQPIELEEFKLIAGKYTFHRWDDEAALMTLAAALRKFRLGQLALHEHEAWEQHFSSNLHDFIN